ncbi:hypothetical protein AVEN_200217-1 [Araneus ventricosus]|uniref:Uncharacterized protein n=1 Tax=Araneus ventricosus TaxID=182803 RepID=A0A4Y2PQL1_ARAVE|nr:hypothetical protein AVEN_200217-1 [Araneus ventricosus]
MSLQLLIDWGRSVLVARFDPGPVGRCRPETDSIEDLPCMGACCTPNHTQCPNSLLPGTEVLRGVPARVASLSDRGSKLRGPSVTALLLLQNGC